MSVAVGTTSAQTPLSPNFGGLKSQVAAYVQGQNLPAVLSDSGLALNMAIDYLNTRNWHWLNRQEDITLTASTRTYTVPAAFKRPRKLEKLDTSGNIVGEFYYMIPKEFQDSNWTDENDGQPEFYTVRNPSDDRLLTFNIAPTSAFVTRWPTAKLTYFSRMQYFADDGDTLGDLEVPPEVRNFLVWYARAEIAGMRGTARQVEEADRAWQRQWFALMKDDTNEQTDWYGIGRYR